MSSRIRNSTNVPPPVNRGLICPRSVSAWASTPSHVPAVAVMSPRSWSVDRGGRHAGGAAAYRSAPSPWPLGRLDADVSVADDDVLAGRQLRQTQRSAGVELLGGDPDFGAESELATVGKPGRRVDHDRGGVDRRGEPAGRVLRVGHDGPGTATSERAPVL